MAPPGGRNRWYFSDQDLANSPSRKCGVSADKEESYRQQAANFIQDMGQRLQVTQLCINTAIVYMQRFYMFHSFTKFHRNYIAAAALFLAAKVEEQPRKLEHVIKVSHVCLNRDQPHLDSKSEKYLEQAQELVSNENILLQTLGFDVAIDHPHTHVVKCCQLVKAHKELAQTSYFMATNSLHLTTMCLRYPPTIVACVCIHLACNWSKYEIPVSAHGKAWFSYVDNEARLDQIQILTKEFLAIFEKCPSRLKKKILQSHNDTKAQEDLRRKENTQNDQYRIDFGDGQSSIVSMQTQHNLSIQPGNPLAGGSQAPKNPSSSSSATASSAAPGAATSSGGKYNNYHPKPQPKPDPRAGPPQPGSGLPKQPHHGGHSQVKGQGQPGYSRPSSSSKHGPEKPGRSQSHGSSSHPQGETEQQRQSRREQFKQSHSQMYPGTSRSMSSSSLPPPYPSKGHPPAQHPKPPHIPAQGMSSMPRSIFDLSPDKSARPEKPPPPVGPIQEPMSGFHDQMLPSQPSFPHPHQSHQAPPPTYNSSLPSYPSSSHSLPPYPKPGEPPFQPPQTISPIRDNPTLAINRQKTLEPGELDTPTPTHIANMFNFSTKQNYSNQQNLVQSKPKDERSLHSILGFTSDNVKNQDQSRSHSKLEKVLFDDDFDDVPLSGVSNLPLPSAPTISNQHSKKNESVSGLSDLFGEDSDSSSFLSTLTQSQTTSQSASFSGSLQALADIPKNENSLLGLKTESPQIRRDAVENRRSSDKVGPPAEKKARTGKSGLFSPSPPQDSKHDLQLGSLISPLKEHDQVKRSRTTSSSSNNDAVVSVQKLENLAPEFQAFKGISGSASIIVGADGLPSPGKLKKESFSSPVKERKPVVEEKRRSTSGHSKEGSQKSPEDKLKEKGLDDKKDHKKKKEKKEKKDKKEKKHKKDKKRDDESKEMKDEERKHKKEKKKSKDKDKEREKDRKLKILPVAQTETAGGGGEQAGQGPLKLKIKLVKNESPQDTKKDNRKRDRSASSAKLDKFEVPAAKMARATGSDRNQEAKFLEESFKKKEKR